MRSKNSPRLEVVEGGAKSAESDENLPLRPLADVLDGDLWPYQGLCPDPDADRRHMAIAYVLTHMAEAGYARLLEAAGTFHWYIPDARLGGEIRPFGENYDFEFGSERATAARVLFLSPEIERMSWDKAVGIVAHELIHIALNHRLLNQPEEYDAQEREVYEKMGEWGFGREAKKMIARIRWRDTRERNEQARLKEEGMARTSAS